MSDDRFPSMGSEARVVLDAADAAPVKAFLDAFERCLTRFDPASELSRLNLAPVETVPASSLLRHLTRAALWAAERSRGLVDPTLLPALRAAGYDRSRTTPELPLAEALTAAPARAPARPDPHARWRHIRVDDGRRAITRPRGIEIDSGGIGKGLAADLAARLVSGTGRHAIDCGGDLRVGGAEADPFELHVIHPLTGEIAHELRIQAGGVATSGLDVRLWRDADHRPAHHLLDPSTGRPAWTGLVGATALAPTALEAEVLAKMALLSGPRGAARILGRHGGLVIRDDGTVDRFGALRPRPVVSLRAGAAA
jgi:thiamine biosynthesis lipoprotein